VSRAIWTLAVLLSHWRRHPMQLATLLIGLISATALWSGVQALNQQARNSYDRAAATFGGTRTAMLAGRDSATFPQQLFVDLRRAGWPVSPVLEGRIQIGGRSFRLLGIEPVTLPAEVGNAPAIGKSNLQSFMTPPGEMLVAPETLSDLKLTEGDTPVSNGGAALPPLRVQPQLVPGVLVVDIGVAQKRLKMPDQLSRLLIGKARGKRAALESITGDKLRLIEPGAESDLERLTDSFHLNLTAFGLLSFFVGLFIVNSAIGLAFEQRLPMLRTLRACGVSARMLNAVLVAELVSLALVAGLVGLVCGYFIAAALLPDVAASLRGLYGAQIPGQLTLKPEWWLAGIAISIVGALAAAAASLIKALRLPLLAAAQPYAWQQAQRRWLMFQSALALAVFALAGGLLWFGGFCGARRVDAGRGIDPADDAGGRACARPALCAASSKRVVLGRQPPAAIGIVAGLDGAVACARGQCRRRHHGGKFQPHVPGLARRPAGGGCLCQRRQRCAGDRDQDLAAHAPRSRGGAARRPRRHAIRRPDRGVGTARSRHLSRQLAAAAIG
jgi:putative ABC transport system permease protein